MPTLQEQLAALAQESPETAQVGVAQRIAELIDAPDAPANAELQAVGLDSLGLIALVVRLEQEFGVRVAAEQASQWTTIADVAGDVEKLKKEQQ